MSFRLIPKLNIRCETRSGPVHGSTSLKVVRVEEENDGSLTAVTDYWPRDVSMLPAGELLEFVEPANHRGDPQYVRVAKSTAIQCAREAAEQAGHPDESDEQLLANFMAVHWAYWVPTEDDMLVVDGKQVAGASVDAIESESAS